MACMLWDVLGSIADRRGRKGRQFPLQAILAIAIAAMLAGANDLRAIFRWGRRLKPEALALFGIERAPCHATYHRRACVPEGPPARRSGHHRRRDVLPARNLSGRQ
jgi:DDE family transposase